MSTTDDSTAGELGLEGRYHVQKINDPTGKHNDCHYFVLDPVHDLIARQALASYRNHARRFDHGPLADDLTAWLDELDHPADPYAECPCGHYKTDHGANGCEWDGCGCQTTYQNEENTMNAINGARTTTTTEQWDGNDWTPVERTVREENAVPNPDPIYSCVVLTREIAWLNEGVEGLRARLALARKVMSTIEDEHAESANSKYCDEGSCRECVITQQINRALAGVA